MARHGIRVSRSDLDAMDVDLGTVASYLCTERVFKITEHCELLLRHSCEKSRVRIRGYIGVVTRVEVLQQLIRGLRQQFCRGYLHAPEREQ